MINIDPWSGLKYYQRERMEWIADCLRVYGFVNRKHIMRKFGMSHPQASSDMTLFRRRNPGAVKYDLSNKMFLDATENNDIVIFTRRNQPSS